MNPWWLALIIPGALVIGVAGCYIWLAVYFGKAMR